MMKDVIIKIDQNSMVYKQETVLGISYENLQGKIIFKFLGTFPKGIAYLEYERDTEKGYLQMNQVGEEYQLEIKSSLLTKEGRIYLQLRVTEDATPEGTPVFKSNKFYLEVKEAINATTEIPDEYPEWIDTANEKIKEMDNLNITTERVEDGVDIVLTDKKGNTTRTEVKDGAPGPQGPQGEPGAVKMQVVDTLPDVGETDTIYLLKKEKPGVQNLYDEYVYTNSSWEHIGDTSVDLSDYYTKEESDTKLNEKQDKLPVYYASMYTSIKDLLPIFNSWLSDYKRTNMMPMFSMGYSNKPYTGKTMYLKSVEYDNTTKLWYFNFSWSTGELSAPITQEIYMLSYDSENEVFLRCQKAGHNGQYLTPMYDFSKGASFGKRALSTTNAEEYIPTADYHPATKKYVDDNVKTYTAGDNITISEDNVISALTGSDYPIYRMIARWDNLSTSGSSVSTITTDETIVNILNNFLTNVANQDNQIGTLTLMNVPSGFDSFPINYIGISNIIQFNQTLKSFKLCLNIHCFGAESRYEFIRKGAFHILSGNGKWENNSFSITSLSLTKSAGDGTGNILFTSATENKVEREYLKKTNTSSYTPTGDYNPSTKLYTDKTHYEKMTGYDATKTQVLKNINGTLTWVDEV